ncbi:MAG: hypothetical protein HY645_13920 [Acidobacteria bacterium]|nr:hypothetical protein [Acidobacteriota bacterium]
MAQSSLGKRFSFKHPGDWRFTYLPNGRIASAYGGFIRLATVGAPSDKENPQLLALRFFEAEKEFFAPLLSAEQLRVVTIEESSTGRHVRMQQVQDGFLVDDAFFEVHLTEDGRVFQVNNSLVSARAVRAPLLSADDAVILAREFLKGGAPDVTDARPRAVSDRLRRLRKELRSRPPEKQAEFPLAGPAELVFYPINNNLRLSWKMIILENPLRQTQVYVDAVRGEILFSTNVIVFER